MRSVVVVGAGLAGARTVEELRTRGFGGEVTLVGAEPWAPYDRPPLSKAVLLDEPAPDTTLGHDLTGAEVLLGRRATGLRPGAVETDAGDVAADAVVIATGADPVRLPGDGPQHALRTVDDARRLRGSLQPGARIAVVGASWIGAEVAGAARAAGCKVTCVELGEAPLHMALGVDVGARTVSWWDGIDLRLGVGVTSVDEGGLSLQDGSFLDADLVLVGIGVRAATGWLEGSGVPLDRGVLVDERLMVELPVDHPWAGRLAAVGDVAAWRSARYGARLRVQHWDDALHGPTTAAAALLGDTDVRHDPVPYFWSDQLGHRMQYVGHHADGDRQVVREGEDAWGVAWVRPDGTLAAFLSVDRPRDLAQARRLATTGVPVDPDRLADPGVALKDCIR
jgi:NADPH-dependent 2,4-dienoyl-CoA reductase/sulfur reductase-like enzyme